MTTQIGELIFESGKTLFEILDALDVTTVANQLDGVTTRLDEVNDQLRQLGSIVDTNQANSNASFIAVNTQLDSLVAEIATLNLELAPLSLQVTELQGNFDSLFEAFNNLDVVVDGFGAQVERLAYDVNTLRLAVNSLNPRVESLTQDVGILQQHDVALTRRVQTLELTSGFNQQLRLGNEYICTYRVGNPGNTYYYRINYRGSTSEIIFANRGYSATVLSSQDGSTRDLTVFLCAPFDVFSTSGRYNYSMIQGPCRISFFANNTSAPEAYVTLI